MPRSAAPLDSGTISEMRRHDAHIWAHSDPTYMNLIDRLLCDVSEDVQIPEPEHGKIITLIRQIGKKLEPYSA